MSTQRPDLCMPFRSMGAKVSLAVALTLTLGAGAAQAALTSAELAFDNLGVSTLGVNVRDGYAGFDWGDQWHYMTTASAPGNTFLALSTSGGTLITRSDRGDFYFDGADFWSRRGVDATGDFYFVLYNDGQVVYNGLEAKNGRMVFKGASSFMTVAAGMPIDAIGFAFDNDDYDHLAMDNFRFRVDATTIGSVTAVPEPHTTAMLLAGLGVIGVMGRRRRQHQAQSEKL